MYRSLKCGPGEGVKCAVVFGRVIYFHLQFFCDFNLLNVELRRISFALTWKRRYATEHSPLLILIAQLQMSPISSNLSFLWQEKVRSRLFLFLLKQLTLLEMCSRSIVIQLLQDIFDINLMKRCEELFVVVENNIDVFKTVFLSDIFADILSNFQSFRNTKKIRNVKHLDWIVWILVIQNEILKVLLFEFWFATLNFIKLERFCLILYEASWNRIYVEKLIRNFFGLGIFLRILQKCNFAHVQRSPQASVTHHKHGVLWADFGAFG